MSQFQPKSDEHIKSYSFNQSLEFCKELFSISRNLNYAINNLEIAVVGRKRSGKSTLIQLIIGEAFPFGKTLRPFHFQLVNNSNIDSYKVTIKEKKDVVVTIDKLSSELGARNMKSDEPVFVQVEYKWGFEITLIDTPPLKNFKDLKNYYKTGSDSNRYVLCLEQTQNLKNLSFLPWIKKIDPSMSRSAQILTNFYEYMNEQLCSPKNVQFHVNSLLEIPCFWITLPSLDITKSCIGNQNELKLHVWELYQRDLDSLKCFDLDNNLHLERIGLYSILRYLHSIFIQEINKHVPLLSRNLLDEMNNIDSKIASINNELNNSDYTTLKTYASKYTLHWLKCIESLIHGSIIGNPKQNGQTLEEEFSDMKFDISNWLSSVSKMSTFNIKLYGSSQVMRLLESFKLISSSLDLPEIEDTEFISSADIAWTASEIARRKVEEQFIPLIEQLLDKTYQIFKRMVTICNKFVGNTYKMEINVHEYPSFTSFLKQSYFSALSEIQNMCLQKCKDELYTVNSIYWELTADIGMMPRFEDDEDRKNKIASATSSLYNNLKDRLIDTIVRHVQTYFLTDEYILKVFKKVASDVQTLKDNSIEEMFNFEQLKLRKRECIKHYESRKKELEEIKEHLKSY